MDKIVIKKDTNIGERHDNVHSIIRELSELYNEERDKLYFIMVNNLGIKSFQEVWAKCQKDGYLELSLARNLLYGEVRLVYGTKEELDV